MPPKVLNPGNAASCVKGTFDVIGRLIRVWICEDIILSIFSVTSLLQNLAHFRVQYLERISRFFLPFVRVAMTKLREKSTLPRLKLSCSRFRKPRPNATIPAVASERVCLSLIQFFSMLRGRRNGTGCILKAVVNRSTRHSEFCRENCRDRRAMDEIE